MIRHLLRFPGVALLVGIALSIGSAAQEAVPWDSARVAELAGQLHMGVKGLRDETRSIPQDYGTGHASAYYRLLDNLRLIERETRYLHQSLEKGADRDTTLPTYRRIATLRRDCADEMERLFLGSTSLKRVARAREIVKQMDPYYGFDPDRDDHGRVLEQ